MYQHNQHNQYYEQQGQPPYPYPPAKPAGPPGSTMLLVTGILLIIFNVIAAFNSLATVMDINTWLWMFGGQSMRVVWQIIYTVGIIFSLAAAGLGVAGIVYANRADKAKILIFAVTTILVATTMYNIVYLVSFFQNSEGIATTIGIFVLFSMPIGYVVPIIFIIGAVRNNNFHKNFYEHTKAQELS